MTLRHHWQDASTTSLSLHSAVLFYNQDNYVAYLSMNNNKKTWCTINN